MPRFHDALLLENADLFKAATEHRFLKQVADGTITKDQFQRWLAQDHFWVREFEQALAILASRAPRQMRRAFFEALLNLHSELELFEETAAGAGVDFAKGKMSQICNAYGSFLLSSSVVRTFEEGLVAVYASEVTYLEAWSYVKRNQTKPSPWQEFVELWTGEGFRTWVESTGGMVDASAEAASPAVRSLMQRSFELALRYELRFWESAFEGTDW
jgi:thiaminase